MTNGAAIVYIVLYALAALWAAFWIIRLAVRYGMNDALRMNRSWLRAEAADDHTAAPTHEPASQSRD